MFENVTDWDFSYENETEKLPDERNWPGRFYPSWGNVSPSSRFGLMLHAYGFAGSFTVLAFYAFFSVLNIRSMIASRPYMSTINVFLCLLGASRAIALFVDPYALRDVMPKAMASAIFDLGTACITSALCLTHLALVHIAQIKMKLKPFSSKTFISVAITLHLSCLIGMDISSALQPRFSYVVKIIIETVFLIWGLTVCAVFLCATHRAMSVLRSMPSSMLDRDLDPNYKGIMQLSALAPYNNLAGSVASALIPTLLAPKIAREAVEVASSSSSSCKSEPMKSSIMKHAKQSPNSSDGEDSTRLCSSIQKNRGTKKLSWGTEQRCSGQPLIKGMNDKKTGIEEEAEEATANTSLLPQQACKDTELTLDAILNHIAYMSRERPCNGAGNGRRRATRALYVAGLSGGLGGSLLGLQLAALYLPNGWIYDGDKRWLCYETLCRSLEISAAWGVANLTKQPVSERVKSPSRHGIFM
ncbi:uncharacterized protein [Halyomorpha halys]|uniref:uncharacterized protein n=2 Tax=Halyomorpha halys TaxID=286706 RepID=UPI0006D4C82B|nr:uncharacterized protein LOC106691611 [Halyomorpha halys]